MTSAIVVTFYLISSVNNFLPAKHQTALKIAYLFTRLAARHSTVEYLEEHRLTKKHFRLSSLRRIIHFCMGRLLNSCLHCNEILFVIFVSNFLTSKLQALVQDTALWNTSKNTVQRKTIQAFREQYSFGREDC